MRAEITNILYVTIAVVDGTCHDDVVVDHTDYSHAINMHHVTYPTTDYVALDFGGLCAVAQTPGEEKLNIRRKLGKSMRSEYPRASRGISAR